MMLHRRLIAVGSLWLLACAVATGDELTLQPDEGRTPFVVSGTIVDYTGEQITVQRGQGSPRRYAASRVVRIETDWPNEYDEGQQSLLGGRYREAVTKLLAAARQDQRPWARRQIMLPLMQAQASAGDWTTAGEMLLAVAASDATTTAINAAPLPWYPVAGMANDTINQWLSDKRPLAQLLGASHALAGAQCDRALAVLTQLANDDDPRVAHLAQAQSWRGQVITATPDTVDRWQDAAREWGDELGGGPWLVIAEARARLGDHDAALLAALRPALLGVAGSPVRARGLLLAAESAHKAEQTQDAGRLVQELLARYPESAERERGTALLKALQDEPSPPLLQVETPELEAAGDEQRFLAGLRERQLYRLVDVYVTRELGRSDVRERDRTRWLVEQALARTADAIDTPPTQRDAKWQAATEPLDTCLASAPEGSLRLVVELQRGLVDLARGAAARLEAKPADESSLAASRDGLRAAIARLTAVQESAQQQERARALRQVRPTADDLSDVELLGIVRGTTLEVARAQRQLALTYSAGSADRDAALLAAAEQLRPLASATVVDPLTWSARVELVETLAALDRGSEIRPFVEAWGEPPAEHQSGWLVARVHAALADGNVAAAQQLLTDAGSNRDPAVDLARVEVALAAKASGEQVAALVDAVRRRHSPHWVRLASSLVGEHSATSSASDPEQQELAAEHYVYAGQYARARDAYDRAAAAWQAKSDRERRIKALERAAATTVAEGNSREAAQRYRQLAFGFPTHTRAAAWHRERLLAQLTLARAEPASESLMRDFQTGCGEHLQHWPRSAEANEVRLWLAQLSLGEQQYPAAIQMALAIDASSPQRNAALSLAVDAYRRLSSNGIDDELLRGATRDLQSCILTGDNQWPREWTTAQRDAALLLAELRLQQSEPSPAYAVQMLLAAEQGQPAPEGQWLQRMLPSLALAQALAGDPVAAQATLARMTGHDEAGATQLCGQIAVRMRAEASNSTRRVALAKLLAPLVDQLPVAEQPRYRALSLSTTDRQQSLELYRVAITQQPRDGDLSEEYAQLLAAGDADDISDALREWQRIEARSRPGGERWYRARLARVRLLNKTGQRDAAERLVAVTQRLYPELGAKMATEGPESE